MHVLLQADQRLKQKKGDVLLPAHPSESLPIGERKWTDAEPEDNSSVDHPVSKQTEYSSSSWSSTSRRRWSDWILENRGISSERSWTISTLVWWKVEENNGKKAEANKKRFQYCTDPSGQEILYLWALQGHSRRSIIDPSLQDNVLIPKRFLRVHLSHRMCNQFTLHHEFRIDTRRTKFEQNTDGILHVYGSNEQGT